MNATKKNESVSVSTVRRSRHRGRHERAEHLDADMPAPCLHRRRGHENRTGDEENFHLVLPFEALAQRMAENDAER